MWRRWALTQGEECGQHPGEHRNLNAHQERKLTWQLRIECVEAPLDGYEALVDGREALIASSDQTTPSVCRRGRIRSRQRGPILLGGTDQAAVPAMRDATYRRASGSYRWRATPHHAAGTDLCGDFVRAEARTWSEGQGRVIIGGEQCALGRPLERGSDRPSRLPEGLSRIGIARTDLGNFGKGFRFDPTFGRSSGRDETDGRHGKTGAGRSGPVIAGRFGTEGSVACPDQLKKS